MDEPNKKGAKYCRPLIIATQGKGASAAKWQATAQFRCRLGEKRVAEI
jgi:hypothetical protein